MAKIISVSRDPLLLRTRALMLEGEHHSVTSCLGAQQAFDQLKQTHDFDVLLLGHTLKVQERLEIARVALSQQTLMRVIVVSSGAIDEEAMREAGFEVCDSSPQQLVAKIQEASGAADSASAG